MQAITQKMLDVSTEHMTEHDANTMAESSVIQYELDQYGWLVWVADESWTSDDGPYAGDRSAAFRKVIDFARAAECDYVRFDRDGPRYDHLESFDW